MAKECGWTIDYIVNHVTYQQAIRTYQLVQLEKLTKVRLYAIATMYATAYGSGNLKKNGWDKFMSSLSPRDKETTPIQMNKNMNKLKSMGLPVEEK